jgi:hypothetical protein
MKNEINLIAESSIKESKKLPHRSSLTDECYYWIILREKLLLNLEFVHRKLKTKKYLQLSRSLSLMIEFLIFCSSMDKVI